MRIFDELTKQIEKEATQLLLKYNELELAQGRINGYRVAPGVYAAIYAFLLHQSNLAKVISKRRRSEHHGVIWFNFGGVAQKNTSVKRFKVIRGADESLRLEASLVTIENGRSPFENITGALCCGNHCSNGCYDICPTFD